jgi:hypothetical protein
VIKRPDGKLQIFALRVPLERESGAGSYPQDIITSVQLPGSTPAFGAWTSLGSPDSPNNGTFVGPPTAVFDGSGRLFVFAKNSNGRISFKVLENGTWWVWSEINNTMVDILDGIAAIERNDGVIEVFATGRTTVSPGKPGGVLYRFIQWNGTSFQTAQLTTNIAGPPTVAKNQDGRLQLFYREQSPSDTCSDGNCYGRVLTMVDTGGAFAAPSVLYGDSGVGPIESMTRGGTGHLMIFQRNAYSTLSAIVQATPNGGWGTLQWQLFNDMPFDEYPAATTDNLGRAVVIVKGTDGKLYMRRETSPAAVGVFGGWTQIGD